MLHELSNTPRYSSHLCHHVTFHPMQFWFYAKSHWSDVHHCLVNSFLSFHTVFNSRTGWMNCREDTIPQFECKSYIVTDDLIDDDIFIRIWGTFQQLLCFTSSTTSKLTVDSISHIFTSRMACDSQGGSLPLLIAVFEGRHFPGHTLSTRSNGILIANVPTASSIPSKLALRLIAPSVNSASPRDPYWFINSIHFSR